MYAITCFSYKGGAGRSTTSANLAAELAKRGSKVAILDADLGAPGLHYLYQAEEVSEGTSYLGAHHLMNDMLAMGTDSLMASLIDVGRFHEDDLGWAIEPGRLFLLASSPRHFPPLGADDQSVHIATLCMKAFRNALIREGFDYLIIDSASGTQQPVAGACMSASDLVLVFLRWTLQHARGTAECVAELLETQMCPDAALATVATSVPSAEEVQDPLMLSRLLVARDEYRSILAKVDASAVPVVEIPEYLPFKWAESIAVYETDLFVPLADYIESCSAESADPVCA